MSDEVLNAEELACPACKKALWTGYDNEYISFNDKFVIIRCQFCNYFAVFRRVV